MHALEIGADDYLVKPFSMRELVARVGAAARRGVQPGGGGSRGDPVEIEELRIDPREVQAFVDGQSAGLTPTEFRLLYTLALDRGTRRHAGRAAPEGLGEARDPSRPHGSTCSALCLPARSSTASRRRHSFIQTRFGVGYKLEAELK